MKKSHHFPHNSRRITAFTSPNPDRKSGEGGTAKSSSLNILYIVGIKMVALSILIAFLAINLFYRLPTDFLNLQAAKTSVMLFPKDVSFHLLLVQEYLKRGNMSAVERELNIAQTLSTYYPLPTTNSVLGLTLSPAKIWTKIKNEPQRIKSEIIFWEKIIADKPEYRDAYLQLALLHYQIYETNKAKEYLQKAKELDPNFEVIKQLEEIIK